MNTETRTINSNEFRLPKSSFWVESRLIRWRWWLFALLGLAIVAFEAFAEPLLLTNPGSFEFDELVIFLIALAAVLLLAEIPLRAVVAKSQAVELLRIKHELSVQLGLAPDWESLTNLILAFCQATIELDGAVLLVHDPESSSFEVVAQLWAGQYLDAHQAGGPRSDNYCTCALTATKYLHAFELSSETNAAVASHGYCLPLRLGDRVIAKLNLFLPAGKSLIERQVNILNNCASDMAIALTAAQLRQAQADLLVDQARSVQRHHISRNLHDALAQKLVYLRFKLDQFANSDEKTRLADICHDLEQMQAVANESYELVRGTLAVLNSSGSPSLLKLLIEHSRLGVDRTRLEFTFDEIGQPQPLPAEALQQIFYIFGEALSNTERHAAAQKVDVKLIWSDTELVIKVADDGRGFETAAAREEGHYGLTFMRERAEALGGHIDLHATPGKGTRLTVQLPICEEKDAQRTRFFAEPSSP